MSVTFLSRSTYLLYMFLTIILFLQQPLKIETCGSWQELAAHQYGRTLPFRILTRYRYSCGFRSK